LLALKVGALTRPFLWWQFVTYGFCHAPLPDIWHLLGNMFVLVVLGRDIELTYGRKEFLRLYLAMIVFSGFVWCVYETIVGTPPNQGAIGASGAITGIVVLYAFHFPYRTLLLFFVIPMPAWVLGVLIVALDSISLLRADAVQPWAANIAHAAHLGGAAFAFAYYRFGWRIAPWTDLRFLTGWFKRRTRLKIHDPDRRRPDENDDADEMSGEVDRILAKIHREGESSLTRKERRTLEAASRRYQKRRGG